MNTAVRERRERVLFAHFVSIVEWERGRHVGETLNLAGNFGGFMLNMGTSGVN